MKCTNCSGEVTVYCARCVVKLEDRIKELAAKEFVYIAKIAQLEQELCTNPDCNSGKVSIHGDFDIDCPKCKARTT